ncbi:MAG TPA: hypothetical protein VGZ25_16420 [Gemmataceae bacterium]|nr:hypothetical protein [Gemmataceae bacterium]
MIRRRRPAREIAFSFDSFLDLVANVVGIIIRLILVVWVGARSYTSLPPGISLVSDDTPAIIEDLPPEEPLKFDLAKDREELDKAQAQLIAELRQLRSAEDIKENTQKEFRSLDDKKQTVASETQKLDNLKKTSQHLAVSAALSLEEIKKRYTRLSEEIIAVRKLPPAKKALTYRTPISRPVQAEEIIFECQNGRVAFIDIGSMLEEVRQGFEDKVQKLRNQWEIEDTTTPIGAFRLHYTVERERGVIEGVSRNSPPDANANFRYGLSSWQVEPLRAKRGETLEAALAPNSEFRHVIDSLDPRQSVITFWVYPDSFAVYRKLRDLLYDRDIVVAGRPLPEGVPISSSRHGTVSRGQ